MKVERDDDKGAQPALAADVCWPAHDRPTSVCLRSVFLSLAGDFF